MEQIREAAAAVLGNRVEAIRERTLAKYNGGEDSETEFSLSEARVLMHEFGLTIYASKTPDVLYRSAGDEATVDMLSPLEGFVKDVDLMELGPRSYFKVFHRTGFDFGWALKAAKNGHLLTRSGWNGKGMFVFIRPADVLAEKFLVDNVKSLPAELKRYYKENPVAKLQSGDVYFKAYFCMKAADGSIVNGWLASQTDMLAEDWMLFTW